MDAPTLLLRPIIGGVFGAGRYSLATMPQVVNGLHSVRFMVVDSTGGQVLAIAEDKTRALTAAREMLHASGIVVAELAGQAVQSELWCPDELPVRPIVDRRRPVSRRRRDIFAKCGGRCHYCAAPLQLDGPWHVEHMLPRALEGTVSGWSSRLESARPLGTMVSTKLR